MSHSFLGAGILCKSPAASPNLPVPAGDGLDSQTGLVLLKERVGHARNQPESPALFGDRLRE